MNKDGLIKKLAGDSFQEYLEACSELPNYEANGGKLNQEIKKARENLKKEKKQRRSRSYYREIEKFEKIG